MVEGKVMKKYVAQFAFSSGELDPDLHDRLDLDAYFNGASRLDNFIPLPQGPIVRRGGSRFIWDIGSNAVRLVPFTFNVDQSFVLVFTPGKMSIAHGDAMLTDADNHIISVTTPWQAQDLPNLNWAQNGDWLYIVDGRQAPRAVKRYANTDWRVENLAFVNQPTEWSGANWPKTICFFKQRVYYGGTSNQPMQIWASRVGLYEEFTYSNIEGEAVDDMALTYTLFSNDVCGIEWIADMGGLMIGTSGAEFKVTSLSALDPITPKNIDVSVQTHYGSAPVRPIILGTNILFVQRARNRVRSFEFTFAEDRYNAEDITLFASHILEGEVIEMSLQSAPDSCAWCVDKLGNLIGCTYEKRQKVLAWHRHNLTGKVKSICVRRTIGDDEIYVAVERPNGTFLEYIPKFWDPPKTIYDACNTDCTMEWSSDEEADEITGLFPLEGQEVAILCDGWVHPNRVVEGGYIKLQHHANNVRVGIPYTSVYESLTPQAQDELTVGYTRRIYEATVAVSKSLDFLYRTTSTTRLDRAYNGPTFKMNEPIQLTTRHERINVPSVSERTQKLHIEQSAPVPLTISGIIFGITPGKV